MPKKLDYNNVKDFIEKESKGNCDLVSTNYINYNIPLVLKCKCGNIFERDFAPNCYIADIYDG